MQPVAVWNLDPMKILTRRELACVLADAKRQAGRSANGRRNLIIVRLACCCGLRVSEISALRLGDVMIDGPRPHLRLRRSSKRGIGRSTRPISEFMSPAESDTAQLLLDLR